MTMQRTRLNLVNRTLFGTFSLTVRFRGFVGFRTLLRDNRRRWLFYNRWLWLGRHHGNRIALIADPPSPVRTINDRYWNVMRHAVYHALFNFVVAERVHIGGVSSRTVTPERRGNFLE
jgi:hypothetical protein